MPRDELYLVEIVEAIDRISRWLRGIDAQKWDDHMLRAAVLQQLTTIGEASRPAPPTDAQWLWRTCHDCWHEACKIVSAN